MSTVCHKSQKSEAVFQWNQDWSEHSEPKVGNEHNMLVKSKPEWIH